jgi:hypothetical protein
MGGILTSSQHSENDTSTGLEEEFMITTYTQSSSGLQSKSNKKQERRVASRKTLKIKKKKIRAGRISAPLLEEV